MVKQKLELTWPPNRSFGQVKLTGHRMRGFIRILYKEITNRIYVYERVH